MEASRTFRHKGRVLQLTAYESEPSGPRKVLSRRAPGAGSIEIRQIDLSAKGEEFMLSAWVDGSNIAFIYTEVLLKDESLDRFYGPVAREYIRAERTKETRGVSRPDWDDSVDLSVKIRPSLRVLTDGVDSAFFFSVPEGYGDPQHRIDGLYAPADGTGEFRARVTFDSGGETKRIVAYKEQGYRSAPHPLAPRRGDRLTPFVQVLTPPAEDGEWKVGTALSTPLTLGDRPFRVVTETPMPGDYLVGLLVQDFDGGLTRKYAPLTIGGESGRPT
jgi:hypothetical protein